MGIFNGDMGIVTEINTYTETLEVEYDEKRKVKYPFELLEELELAYAITIPQVAGKRISGGCHPSSERTRDSCFTGIFFTRQSTRARKCDNCRK